MTGVRRVVYHANRLQGEPTISVTEGEMDADLLWSHGLPATTNPGGAGKWRAEYATMLKSAGCQWVVILTDNDPPGEKHGRDVARSCSDAMRSREVQKGPVQEQVFRVRDMRRSDLECLSVLYKGLDETAETPGPAAALEVDVPDWDRLRASILADLSVEPPYGIAWWAPHPGTSRRILISDQLFACTQSTGENLIEAGIHWLDFLDYSEKESDRLANAVSLVNGQFSVTAPRPQSPLEEAGPRLVRLHVVGVVRALSGALDCLAGTIIGVTAIPSNILRADLKGVRDFLRKKAAAGATTEADRLQLQFRGAFEGLVEGLGPRGWLDWVLAFRNMLVHRGRRIEIGQFVPRDPPILDARGRFVPRVNVMTHLPLDPGRSDVEVFRDPSVTSVLTEDAHDTLSGVIQSTRTLINRCGVELLELWNWRRAHRESVPQPARQWPHGVSTASLGFVGYRPGSLSYSPTLFTSHPVFGQRLRAAALDDRARGQWNDFD